MRRVTNWLADEKARDQRSIAITHSTTIRAAIVHAMDAPPQSFWRVDIRPLSVTRLRGNGGVWKIVGEAIRAWFGIIFIKFPSVSILHIRLTLDARRAARFLMFRHEDTEDHRG
jgi:broad specificity phosphatase PhoE